MKGIAQILFGIFCAVNGFGWSWCDTIDGHDGFPFFWVVGIPFLIVGFVFAIKGLVTCMKSESK